MECVPHNTEAASGGVRHLQNDTVPECGDRKTFQQRTSVVNRIPEFQSSRDHRRVSCSTDMYVRDGLSRTRFAAFLLWHAVRLEEPFGSHESRENTMGKATCVWEPRLCTSCRASWTSSHEIKIPMSTLTLKAHCFVCICFVYCNTSSGCSNVIYTAYTAEDEDEDVQQELRIRPLPVLIVLIALFGTDLTHGMVSKVTASFNLSHHNVFDWIIPLPRALS